MSKLCDKSHFLNSILKTKKNCDSKYLNIKNLYRKKAMAFALNPVFGDNAY